MTYTTARDITESAALASAYAAYRATETERRYAVALDQYTEAASRLVADGKTVGRKNLNLLTGLVSYKNNPTRGRAMREVIQRFRVPDVFAAVKVSQNHQGA